MSKELDALVRGITAAAKTLRLYPPSSPIPKQSVESASASLAAFLEAEPVLSLAVARDGFSYAGEPVSANAPGVGDLADAMRAHGVAEVDFTPGCSTDELLAFLAAVMEKPKDLRERGGLGATLTANGIEHIRTAEVSLTVIGLDEVPIGADAEAFLQDLAGDSGKLGMWLSVAAKGDPTTMAAGLADLAQAAGPGGVARLQDSLATAFNAQDADVRDSLLGMALEPGEARQLIGGMLDRVATPEIAGALCSGVFGKNMLSMSTALAKLPLSSRAADIMAQVKDILPTLGHSAKELDFLHHMVDIRESETPEAPLLDAQPVYRKVAELTKVDDATMATARRGIDESTAHINHASVTTMLTLLDQQERPELYFRTLDSLARSVPSLIEQGDLTVAARVLAEISAREGRTVQPWPELTERLRAAMNDATSHRSMKALLAAVASNPTAVGEAREIMQHAAESAHAAFIDEALALKPDGLDIAQQVVGRRMVDLLAAAASRAQWFQVAPLVAHLAREGDARSIAAIESMARRGDEQSRRETASGLAAAGGPAAVRVLTQLLKDPSVEVAMIAARGLAKVNLPGAAAALGDALATLDVDTKDYPLAREIVLALAKAQDPAAGPVLEKIAGRRAFIKRGHFADLNELARQALAARAKGGAVR
jgi:HEAT repeat protein